MAGVTPWTPVGQVPRLDLVVATAHRLLLLNRLSHGHATTGDARIDRRHWVYGRARRPCRRCGTGIRTSSARTSSIGTASVQEERVVFWCPRCQSGPVSSDISLGTNES
jgi:endonuclease-8